MIHSGDTAFILLCAALVCLMTPGLAFFYCGFIRKKNVLTIMMQNFISMGVVALAWFVCGFSLAFGPDKHGIIGGLKYVFLRGVGLRPSGVYGTTIPFLAFFIFQLMFAVIAPALMTGAFADRMNFKSYLIFLTAWSLLVYVPTAHWVWGGGFLQKLGVADFAGGIVVHLSSGVGALASAMFVGKRKFQPGEDLRPHNIPYVALGTGLLWFGWFGFNGGSALKANGQAAVAIVNTFLAGAAAMMVWLLVSRIREGHSSFAASLTGAVAGLAMVTPASGYVEPWAAVVIGIAAGLICYTAVRLRAKSGVDDALDVWGVHGISGIFGPLFLGLFATAGIGGIQGGAHQFLIELLAVAVVAIYSYVVTLLLLKLINCFTPVRVSESVEKDGLDNALHGETAYADDTEPVCVKN